MTLAQADAQLLIRDAVSADLSVALQKLFHSADAAVLNLARESSDNKEQNRYFEAALGLRIVHRNLNDSFLNLLFTEHESGVDVDPAHLQSLQRLCSVRTADDVRDASLDARLQAVSPQLRNPFTPSFFMECFLRSLAQSAFDMHTKMLVLRLFETQAYAKLGHFVELANSALLEAGVLPELENKAALTASVDDLVGAALGSAVPEVAEQESPLAMALSDLQADALEGLDEVLAPAAVLTSKAQTPIDIMASLPDASVNFSAQDVSRVALVAELFSALLSEDDLAGVAKVMLALLQLPYARIALAEQDFLTSEAHPARALLVQIAEAAESWEPGDTVEAIESDHLYIQLQEIIQTFYEAERVRHIPFAELHFDLIAFAEEQRQKSLRYTKQLVDSANSASSSDQARAEINRVLNSKISRASCGDEIRRVLNDGWSHVLYVQALEFGIDSEAWNAALGVVDQLLETAKPASEYDNREALLSLLPSVLHALRMGMYSIDLSSALINQLLASLEQFHKNLILKITDSGCLADFAGSALQQKDSPSALTMMAQRKERAKQEQAKPAASKSETVKAAESTVVANPLPESVDNELQPSASEASCAEVPSGIEANMDAILASIGQGVWLNWNKDDKKERCQIAAHIKHAQKYILTNRAGRKIAELKELEMAELLVAGELELADSGQMFEKTLESVIGGMRGDR